MTENSSGLVSNKSPIGERLEYDNRLKEKVKSKASSSRQKSSIAGRKDNSVSISQIGYLNFLKKEGPTLTVKNSDRQYNQMHINNHSKHRPTASLIGELDGKKSVRGMNVQQEQGKKEKETKQIAKSFIDSTRIGGLNNVWSRAGKLKK